VDSTVATRLGIHVIPFPALQGRAKIKSRYAAVELHIRIAKKKHSVIRQPHPS
jgi:hypothetical protein